MTTQVKVKVIEGRIRVRSDPIGIAAGGTGFRDMIPGDSWTINFPLDTLQPIVVQDLETRVNPTTRMRVPPVVAITNLDSSATVSVQKEAGGFAPDLPLGGNDINIPGRQGALRILPLGSANIILPYQVRLLVWPTAT